MMVQAPPPGGGGPPPAPTVATATTSIGTYCACGVSVVFATAWTMNNPDNTNYKTTVDRNDGTGFVAWLTDEPNVASDSENYDTGVQGDPAFSDQQPQITIRVKVIRRSDSQVMDSKDSNTTSAFCGPAC